LQEDEIIREVTTEVFGFNRIVAVVSDHSPSTPGSSVSSVVKEDMSVEEVSNNSQVSSFVPARERGITSLLGGAPWEVISQLSALSRVEINVETCARDDTSGIGTNNRVSTVSAIGAMGRGDEPGSQPGNISSDDTDKESEDEDLGHFVN